MSRRISIANLSPSAQRQVVAQMGATIENENKYKNQPTTVDGIWFPSKLEANHYAKLALRKRIGEIKDLVLQPSYPIIINEIKCGTYRADFSYVDLVSGAHRVVDTKGKDTPLSNFKRKCVEALYGVKIEVSKK